MLAMQNIHSYGWPQTLRPLELRQKQGVGKSLRIGICELRIVGVREQNPAPFISQISKRAVNAV